ncbi:ubiquinone/menaquinone biosynthesis C-methylase UbiE [Gillisia mitskevichiae]|uniref:Ubiquinone/menaquinone biosynthesis C-methylase UbiE n=1 Tax=Gillisia mitskevichiae TaxID=270921 RepID=A0A495PR42_9FLAO|nr:class I SAM-dependent methyltransferase [Gillisia mitskevichiae]RKS53073.1 ubiquinone/menaquinone biosynthesis C-methylase UbiE [Gillisia mitskevichiae]
MESVNNIALEFNEFSKNYTNDMIGCVPHYKELISSFIKYLPDNFSPISILDLGCGNGNITSQLISHFPNATYTMVDASSEMIELCRKQFKSHNVIYSNMYFNDFIFKPESYDLIVAGFSLHHCDYKEKRSIFKAIYSSLKIGGMFSYSDLMINKTNPDHPVLLDEWHHFVNSNFPDGEKWAWVMEHYKAFDKPTDYLDQIECLRNVGFTNIQIPFKEGYWVYLQAVKS